jgi:hypothetical protein
VPDPSVEAIRVDAVMKRLKLVWWSLPSVILLGVTAFVIRHVVRTFTTDATLRWTVIAVVLAGSALLVAAIGLPLALYQLVALDRDLARPSELRSRLVEYRRSGQAIRTRWRSQQADYGELAREIGQWADDIAAFINSELSDDTEADDFRQEGKDFAPDEELVAKLTYIRDKLLPKVITGYW